MRKWLIGLAVAGGIAIVSRVFMNRRRRLILEEHCRAIEHAESFLRHISFHHIAELANRTRLFPEENAWIDRYEGRFGDESFIFSVGAAVSSSSDTSDRTWTYILQWREMLIQARFDTALMGNEPNVFERIHERLKRALQESADSSDDDTQPS